MSIHKSVFSTVIESTSDDPAMTISTIAEDRDRDVVVPEGLDLARYRRNPVVLFGHNHDDLPVAVTTAIEVLPGRGVRAKFRWLEGDARADRVRNAFEQGALRAASIGFLPRTSTPRPNGGLRFDAAELLEWSLCAIPSNPEAVRTLKGLGLDDASDAPVLDVDEADVRDALRAELPAVIKSVLGEMARTAAQEALDHARGRLSDDVVSIIGDPAGVRVKRASSRAAFVGTIDIDPDDVVHAVHAVVPGLVASEIDRHVRAAVRHAAGKLD